jgi:predicted RNA-binding Zn ribbon-like protein
MNQKRLLSKYNKFRFDTGSLSLNFVATVRHRGSQPRDLLFSPEALNQWFQQSGLLSAPVPVSPEDHKNAILLREAIHDTAYALISSSKPEKNDLTIINRFAKNAIPIPQLTADTCSIKWNIPYTAMSCFALIALDAITLIGDTDRQRLKMCENSSCRMLFTDISPANRRRWCSMSICGNRAKVALHRKNMKGIEQA